jgi:class 3 adenylate cyclase
LPLFPHRPRLRPQAPLGKTSGQGADGEILLSARACLAVQDAFAVESGGELALNGIHAATEVFRVLGPQQG